MLVRIKELKIVFSALNEAHQFVSKQRRSLV